MATKKTLPNQALMNGAYNAFSNLSTKMVELNNCYLEQAKSFWQANMEHSQTLYEVSTPDEFVKKVTEVFSKNGELVAKSFLDNMNRVLVMCHEACGSSVGGANQVQTEAMKFFDFYTKLLPSPSSYKLDDVVKRAALGNHDAIGSLQKIVENMMKNFGSLLQNSADAALNNLGQLDKMAKKAK